MALLTKEERQTLEPEARRALKRLRRADRALRRVAALAKIGINVEALREAAREAILDIAAELLPGEDKMLAVLDELAGRADDLLVWPAELGLLAVLLEAGDGLALRALVRLVLAPYVQALYDELESAGEV